MNRLLRLLPFTLFLFTTAIPALAQGSAFTYQGHLSSGGSPANDVYVMSFALYDAATNGTLIDSQNLDPVPVTNGLFSVRLDFGFEAFNGDARWLEISVSVFGSGQPPATLTPRQPVLPVPYAIHAANAANL